MATQDDFQERSAAFMRWLPSASASVSEKVKLEDLRHRGAGRGLIAVQDIQEGEVLFAIPRSAVLSAANSPLSTTLPQIFEDLDPWGTLIVTMIYEYLRGDASPWKPYFDILPAHFDTLMFWSDEELAELQASAVVQKIGKDSANELFNGTVIPLLRRHANVFFPDPSVAQGVTDDELLTLAHRMGSTIMAYAFDIEPDQATQEVDEEGYASEEEDEALPKGMVPLADMLNADADRNNARLHYGSDVLTMEAITGIKAGDEIFNDYGPLPRSDLLRRYGYSTPFYEQYDVVEIPTDLIVETLKAETKVSDEEIEEKVKENLPIRSSEPFSLTPPTPHSSPTSRTKTSSRPATTSAATPNKIPPPSRVLSWASCSPRSMSRTPTSSACRRRASSPSRTSPRRRPLCCGKLSPSAPPSTPPRLPKTSSAYLRALPTWVTPGRPWPTQCGSAKRRS
ncbi:Ribosomal N-lysine methyltransferase 4 [Diplodia seriata]|uniref:Ribosomal N-lysine methyltransferase 4 n=1 Tax=Diplodia seriata TaxID=420778 RepID=A0A1S8BNM7_9PEZI|nr:Ribosomal N-lysine methyltransferase 4 [Diplodia seriata]